MASSSRPAPLDVAPRDQRDAETMVERLKKFGLSQVKAFAFVQDYTNGNDATIGARLFNSPVVTSVNEATGETEVDIWNPAVRPMEARLHVRVTLEEGVNIVALNRERFNNLRDALEVQDRALEKGRSLALAIDLYVQEHQLQGLEGMPQAELTRWLASIMVALYGGAQITVAAGNSDRTIAATTPQLLFLLGLQWRQLMFQRSANTSRTILSLFESMAPSSVSIALLLYSLGNPDFYHSSSYVLGASISRILISNFRLAVEPLLRFLQARNMDARRIATDLGNTPMQTATGNLLDAGTAYHQSLQLAQTVVSDNRGASRGLGRNTSNYLDVGYNLTRRVAGSGHATHQRPDNVDLEGKEANLLVALSVTAMLIGPSIGGSEYLLANSISIAVDMDIRAILDMVARGISEEEASRRVQTRTTNAFFVTLPLALINKYGPDKALDNPVIFSLTVGLGLLLSQLFGYRLPPLIALITKRPSRYALVVLKFTWKLVTIVAHYLKIVAVAAFRYIVEQYEESNRITREQVVAAANASLNIERDVEAAVEEVVREIEEDQHEEENAGERAMEELGQELEGARQMIEDRDRNLTLGDILQPQDEEDEAVVADIRRSISSMPEVSGAFPADTE